MDEDHKIAVDISRRMAEDISDQVALVYDKYKDEVIVLDYSTQPAILKFCLHIVMCRFMNALCFGDVDQLTEELDFGKSMALDTFHKLKQSHPSIH